MIRVMLGQRENKVFDQETIDRAKQLTNTFETEGFHVSPLTSNVNKLFFVSIISKASTLSMAEHYAREIIAKVQSCGIPMVISQVRFNREDRDPS